MCKNLAEGFEGLVGIDKKTVEKNIADILDKNRKDHEKMSNAVLRKIVEKDKNADNSTLPDK